MDELRLEDMEIVVAHDYEDWWRLKDCQLLFVRKGTTVLMGEDYQSKWWRYFEGENPILSPNLCVGIDSDPDTSLRHLSKVIEIGEGRTYED